MEIAIRAARRYGMPKGTEMQREEEEGSDSISEGEPARPIFLNNRGQPLSLYIHGSVKRSRTRSHLKRWIRNFGGKLVNREVEANIVLVDDMNVNLGVLQVSYRMAGRNAIVEPYSFVRRCISSGSVEPNYFRPKFRAMGGRTGPVRSRKAFTEEDDQHLARYLSRRAPYKEDGGRGGNQLYQELANMAKVAPTMHAWANNHPWQSWRNRYNKNQAYFDNLIKDMVEDEPDPRERYPFLRRKLLEVRGLGSDDEQFEERASMGDRSSVETSPVVRRERGRRVSGTTGGSPRPARQARPDPGQSHGEQRQHQQEEEEEEVESNAQEEAKPSSLFSASGDDSENDLQGDVLPLLQTSPPRAKPPFQQIPSDNSGPLPTPLSQTPRFARVGKQPPSGGAHHLAPAPGQDGAEVSGAIRRSLSPVEVIDGAVAKPQDPERPRPRPVRKQVLQPVLEAIVPPRSQLAEPMEITAAKPQKEDGPRSRKRRKQPAQDSLERPYTRARTRSLSIEPVELQFPLSRRVRKRKAQPLQVVPEMHDDNHAVENPNVADGTQQVSLADSRAEEIDVENILIADGDPASVPSALAENLDAPRPEPMPVGMLTRRDTDDLQTERTLRQAASGPPRRFKADRDPHEFLQTFFHDLQNNRTPTRNATPHRGSAQLPTPSHNRLHRHSTTSTDEFPLAGTQAKVVKDRREEEEKQSPYRPPAGTRAAQAVNNTPERITRRYK